MRCLISESNDPYFNLASEEYLLKNSQEDIFMLYINDACVVVGKHQNLLSEINLSYIIEQKIKLARRISGGGTVYQDLNNLNFSFIRCCQNTEKINFEKITFPILNALLKLNLNVKFSERHDILIDDKKISGNAMHVYRNRVLSHGTLLYGSDLTHLSQALKNNPNKYSDRSIKSVKSKVTNLNNYLKSGLNCFEFSKLIAEMIEFDIPTITNKKLTLNEINEIDKLANEKFQTFEWIYGYSPKYFFSNSILVDQDFLEFKLEVIKGIIKDIHTTTKTKDNNYINKINSLLDVRHEYFTIYNLLHKQNCDNPQKSIDLTNFCSYLF